MKKLLTIFLTFVLFISFTTKASAKILTKQNGNVDLPKEETINDDLLVGAKTVNLNSTVNGDVFIGAETVTIDGVINGNLHIGAGTVNLKGQVKGNVYIGSGNVIIAESNIEGSILVGAGTLILDKNTVIGGSVFAAGGNITIDSQIKRNLYLGAGNAVVQGDTKIGMDFYYAINENNDGVVISNNAVVMGNTHKNVYKTPQQQDPKNTQQQFASFKLIMSIFSFVSALLIGFLYFKFFKNHLIESSSIVSKQFWKSLGIGFIIILTILPAVLILLITIIGIPLICILSLIISLFICLSKFVVSMSLGNWISDKFKWKKVTGYWAFALGLLVFYLVKIIPIIGCISSFTVIILGLGALTLNLFNKNK